MISLKKKKVYSKKNIFSLAFATLLPTLFLILLLWTPFAPQLPLSASQDAMRETSEQIRELEKALRESMNTSAHREALWAQEETARVQAQRQVYMMIARTDFETSIHIYTNSYTQIVSCIRTSEAWPTFKPGQVPAHWGLRRSTEKMCGTWLHHHVAGSVTADRLQLKNHPKSLNMYLLTKKCHYLK